MANDKITISQLLTIKGGTLEELYQYAKEKGITLPMDPNYAMSPSELNAVDPQLAFNFRYGKLVITSKDNITNSSEGKLASETFDDSHLQEGVKIVPKVNVLGKIDLSTLNISSRHKSKRKEGLPGFCITIFQYCHKPHYNL